MRTMNGESLALAAALAAAAAAGAALMALVQRRSAANGGCGRQRGDGEDSGEPLFTEILWQDGAPKSDGHVAVRQRRMSCAEMNRRSLDFLRLLNQRRSLRFFSRDAVPRETVDRCVLAAGTAPSGAHCQPWRFCIVESAAVKQDIRELVEKEEQINYERRMRRSWVKDVEHLLTGLHDVSDVRKPYLTDAPLLCVVMKETFAIGSDGERQENYYPEQSVGIAVGMFLAALTNAGLVTLTSTPMGAEKAIRQLLGRPDNEKVYLLMPIGFAAKDATAPYRDDKTLRKPLRDITSSH